MLKTDSFSSFFQKLGKLIQKRTLLGFLNVLWYQLRKRKLKIDEFRVLKKKNPVIDIPQKSNMAAIIMQIR